MESRENILEYIEKYLHQSRKSKVENRKSAIKSLVIVTPNPEQIVLAQNDKYFADILNQADVALPDGIGLALASRFRKFQIPNSKTQTKLQRIPGVEFMEDLVELAVAKGYRIGLIGGRGGVAVRALECLQARFPGIKGWAEEPGDVDPGNLGNLGDLVEKIQKTNTKIVFVGLGAPKQEYLISVFSSQLSDKGSSVVSRSVPDKQKTGKPDSDNRVVLMSVGGSFDMIAGSVKRAPWIIRSMGLEWLWRLLREPWRFRRQLALLKFLWLVVRKPGRV